MRTQDCESPYNQGCVVSDFSWFVSDFLGVHVSDFGVRMFPVSEQVKRLVSDFLGSLFPTFLGLFPTFGGVHFSDFWVHMVPVCEQVKRLASDLLGSLFPTFLVLFRTF